MSLDTEVTRKKISLGSRDATTGWRAPTFTDETIEMLVFDRGVATAMLPPGAYVKLDALGMTADPTNEADQILMDDGRRYEVEGVEDRWLLDSFVRRDCHMRKLPLWQASPGTATWTKSRGSDARYRTKLYIDTYVRDAQLTKDDDSTQASWACIVKNPPYHMSLEFRASSSPVQGLYVLGQPETTALKSGDLTTWGYRETVPIHICTVDSTVCTGTILAQKMEQEMRYVNETYPEGSVRGFERRRGNDHALGSMWLYDTIYSLTYTKDVTT